MNLSYVSGVRSLQQVLVTLSLSKALQHLCGHQPIQILVHVAGHLDWPGEFGRKLLNTGATFSVRGPKSG